jgi:glycosyltransferase involved in cell wall biosynthesis
VIAGNARGAYGDQVKSYIAGAGMDKQIVFPGYMTEGQISYLYKNAQALAFPSLVEGFGFPVMEAMDCGTPVITSDVSSLAELGAGGSAILVNPHAPSDIARAMRGIADDDALRSRLADAGRKRSKEFSWEKRIEVFLDVITK